MEPARQRIILADDDPVVTEALALALERENRTLIVCSDIESAEMMLAQCEVTHLITDVQFSGAFGFEGLHFVARIRERAPRCRIVVITGYATDALREAARGLGADAVLAKPFSVDELEAIVGDSSYPEDGSSTYDVVRVPSIDELLHGDTVTSAFQPIVRLTDDGATPFAYEALTRVRGPWLPAGPAVLFDYASRRSRLPDLNLHALTRAIADAMTLPGNPLLFINVDPITFEGGSLAGKLESAARVGGIALDRIVLEITERSAFADDAAAARVCEELRGAGVRFALDDHGSAYSHLSVIHRIRPSFIKISQTFGTGLELDPTKRMIVRNVLALARDFGCETILEGIECEATARAAFADGVGLAQGFHFGRPLAAAQWAATAKAGLRAA